MNSIDRSRPIRHHRFLTARSWLPRESWTQSSRKSARRAGAVLTMPDRLRCRPSKRSRACKTMCGIYGQFNFRDNAPVAERDIRQATETIAHRGPDDEGFYVSGPVGLGFRRLSIIDLAGGHQPMSDVERRVWVIFNGEIY